MEKRSVIALLITSLIFILYFTFFVDQNPPPGPNPESHSTGSLETQQTPASLPATTSKLQVELKPEELFDLQTPLYHAQISTHDATMKKWELKNYRETTQKNSPLMDLFQGEPSGNFKVYFRDANFSLPEKIPFEVTQKTDQAVQYEWSNSQLTFSKRYEWNPSQYTLKVKIRLENHTDQAWSASPGFEMSTFQHPHHEGHLNFLRGPQNQKYPVYYNEKGVNHQQSFDKMDSLQGALHWVALEDRYFLWAIISQTVSGDNRAQYLSQPSGLLSAQLIYPKEIITPGGSLEKEFTVYVGPKEMDDLKSVGVALEDAVDYGWFGLVARPILWLLKQFHRVIGNWGLSIIALTLFIKLLLHPVNKKTMESMRAMQKLQPKLQEMREKYKNDRERQQVEMMNLFKAHKVNPMGGCLPMLLQMPVYIALYKVLYNAIELYQAPFFWYYRDLSAPDPYFISPILLGIFMVLQQKLTPSAAQDPDQAKMMMFMPLIFSAFMLFLPSGLVIYIFVNTFMSVVQQYMHQHGLGFTDLMQGRWKKV